LIDEKEVIDESSRAAVIKLNETSFAKVKNNKIITYIIKNNKWVRTKPKPIKETKYNFPENIEAVYRSKDNFEYYFRKQKFCKRKVKNYKEVCFKKFKNFFLIIKRNSIFIQNFMSVFSVTNGYQMKFFLAVTQESIHTWILCVRTKPLIVFSKSGKKFIYFGKRNIGFLIPNELNINLWENVLKETKMCPKNGKALM
jgi:hypothetical protein